MWVDDLFSQTAPPSLEYLTTPLQQNTKRQHHILPFLLPAQAYDQHLNMILGDVEETVTSTEVDEETFEEIIKVRWFISIEGTL